MIPQAEPFEAQERLRRMRLIAEYLQTTTAADDPLRVSFVNYLAGYANSISAERTMKDRAINPIGPILLPLQTQANASSKTTR